MIIKTKALKGEAINTVGAGDSLLAGLVDEYLKNDFDLYCRTYSINLYNNESIKTIINSLNNHKTFLFHCHGGKDRTGVIALLILSSFGFTKEEIIKDYLKTNNKFIYKISRLLKLLGFNKNGLKLLDLNTFAIKDLINLTFKEIDEKYQTVENFLLQEYNVTKENLTDWKDYYLK